MAPSHLGLPNMAQSQERRETCRQAGCHGVIHYWVIMGTPQTHNYVSSPRIPAQGDLVSIFVTSWTNAHGQMAAPPNAFDGLASASR